MKTKAPGARSVKYDFGCHLSVFPRGALVSDIFGSLRVFVTSRQ